MAKPSVNVRFADSRVVCPKCAGLTWFPADLVELYVGGKTITTLVVCCGNCGYRRLKPTAPHGEAGEPHDP